MECARITARHDQLGGEPCICGLRIPVATVVYMVADGMIGLAILDAYPDLEAENIKEAVWYAANMADQRITHPIATASL